MNQDIRLSREQRAEATVSLIDSLRASQNASDMMDEAVCDFLGINRTDLRCLDVVDRQGQMTAGELAAAVGLTTGAATALVDRLEAARLLMRKGDPHDRRKVLIALTPDAKQLTAGIYEELARATAPLIASLSDRDLLTLIAFFDASTRVNRELNEAIRSRNPKRRAGLQYRIEQAKAVKREATELLKNLKTDVKDLASIVIVAGGSRWERDESGRWVESRDEESS